MLRDGVAVSAREEAPEQGSIFQWGLSYLFDVLLYYREVAWEAIWC